MKDDAFDDTAFDEIDREKPTAKPDTPPTDGGTALAQSPAQPLIHPLDLYLQREDGDIAFFEGDYVFFNGQTGKWSRGSDKEPINATVPFLCNMHEIHIGWLKFVPDSKPERKIGRIVDGYVRPAREALDDLEEQYWPVNRRGDREDPWKRVTYLPMRCMEDGAPVVYGPFSDTARRAIKSFIAIYRRSNRAGKFPVVLLETGSFPNKAGGTTFVPEFKIIGWEYWSGQPAPEPQPVTPPPPAPAKPSVKALPKRGELSDMDDEIPFE
jgi:hypothetical protein